MLALTLIASLAAAPALAQITMADLEGTWSSGTNYVSTGGVSFKSRCFQLTAQDFCNPSLSLFNVPNNTGMSFSLCVKRLPTDT